MTNDKWQTRPLVRGRSTETRQQLSDNNLRTEVTSRRVGSIPRHTGWLTVSCNVTSTSNAWGYSFPGRNKYRNLAPSGFGESQKLRQWVPRDSDPRKTVLARPSKKWKPQTRPLVRKGGTHHETRNCLKATEARRREIGRGRRWGLTPRQTGRLTVGRNITSNFTFDVPHRVEWKDKRKKVKSNL
jgi:hypothetical protein